MAFRGLDAPTGQTLPALLAWISRLRDMVNNNLLRGKINATIDVTLDHDSDTTDLQSPLLSGMSYIGFCPLTDTAAAEVPTLYVSARGNQTATLSHTNSPDTTRDFSLIIIG